MEANVRAPGVLKLLGEHAVVYGKLSVAAAVDLYATAEASLVDAADVIVVLEDLKKTFRFTRVDLQECYENYKRHPLKTMDDVNGFIENSKIDQEALPYAVIAARLAHQYDVNVGGLRVRIASNIPMQKGYASSAACCTAFAEAVQCADCSKLPDDDLIDVARDGERIIHRNPGAGGIDVVTSYYGGIVSFKAGRSPQAVREDVDCDFSIVVIDTGPKKPTAETVGHVRAMRKAKPEFVDGRLDSIDECSEMGLGALRNGQFTDLGSWMNRDQGLLAELGVSNDRLDIAIHVARENGALGAKLSGGGGGGNAIAISDDPGRLAGLLKSMRFDVAIVGISQVGVGQVDQRKKLAARL